MSFGNIIIGNEPMLQGLERSIYNNKFTHAHLFVGEDGIGKSLIANRLGKLILGCEKNLEHVDLIHWKIGKNKKSLGVDDIRILNEEVNKRPYEGNNKVVIVYNADKMTTQAQNAFLKTIEEPPLGVYIFLLCENLQSILETIKSRCQVHKLRPLSLMEMESFLRKNYSDLNEEEIKLLIAFSDGIPGKAETLVFDDSFKNMRNIIIDFLIKVKELDKIGVLQYEETFIKFKEREEDFFQCLITFLRDAILYKEVGSKELLINMDKIEQLEKLCSMFSFCQLNDIIKVVREGKENLNKNLNASLAFSTMLLKIQEV